MSKAVFDYTTTAFSVAGEFCACIVLLVGGSALVGIATLI